MTTPCADLEVGWSGGGGKSPENFFVVKHCHISQRAVRTSLEKRLERLDPERFNCFSRGVRTNISKET